MRKLNNKRLISFLMAGFTAVSCMNLGTVPTAAAQESAIVIDGAFEDWKGISGTNVKEDNWWYENISVTYDDTFVYMHVAETNSEVWETRFPTLYFNVNESVKQLVLARTSYLYMDGTFDFNVCNAWYQKLPNSTGKVTRKAGKYEWELAVPIQALIASEGNEPTGTPAPVANDGISVRISANGTNIELAAVALGEAGGTDSPETPTTPDTPVIPEEPGDMDEPSKDVEPTKSDIVIDGYYDDWSNAPATLISYGSWNQHGDYIMEHHKGKLLIDDENLYIHVNMCDTYHRQIPLDMLNITINGETRAFCIRYENSDGTVNWDSSVYSLSDGIHTNLGFFAVGDAKNSLGDVAITIMPKHEGDSFEVAVNLDKLLTYYNIDKSTVTNGAEIKFYSPNIGPEAVVIIGTSTNPVLGIVLCVLFVGCVAILAKGKKIQKED